MCYLWGDYMCHQMRLLKTILLVFSMSIVFLFLGCQKETIEYQLTFDSGNGHLSETDQVIIAKAGDLILLPVPSKDNHLFDGWYTDLQFNNAFDTEKMPSESITLYAKWRINEYTITFESNGGSAIDPLHAPYGAIITLPSPQKDGKVFHGWYQDSMFKHAFNQDTIPDENVTLYAAYRDARGFFLESSVPETIDGILVKERFGTNRQGFVQVNETLHYIGGVGPHLTNDDGRFIGFPYYSNLHISYNTITKDWRLHQDLPARAGFLDAVADGTDIYILGGEWVDEDGYVEPYSLRYDTLTGEYHTIAEPPFFFQATNGSVIHDKKIYVFAGLRQNFALPYPSFENTQATLVYDIENNDWSLVAEQPFSTAGGSAALVDDMIYVYRSRGVSVAHFASYDPFTNQWNTDLPHPEYQVSHSSSLDYNGQFLITGGWLTGINTTSGVLQVYCPSENTWTVLSVLQDDSNRDIGYVAVYKINETLYILGGESHDMESSRYTSHYALYAFNENWIYGVND